VPLERYADVAGQDALEELTDLSRTLRGARLAHVNATAYGGGVSELLRSLVPIYRGLGIEAEWLVVPGNEDFFRVTKAIHNALQGAELELSEEDEALYLEHSRALAEALGSGFDFVVVHDPQPAALRRIRGPDGARWVWRCHIDTSDPNAPVLDFLMPFIKAHDALVFTLEEFVPAALRDRRVAVIPPGIDPLSPKNLTIPTNVCSELVQWAGVHLDRPLITQISRFDPWKDPLGVIEAYRGIREEVPGTQLALLGQMALDDPEGWEMYGQILDEARGDPDIDVLTNFTGIGNAEVNAFQSTADIVLQKSIREGFGLVVSETLWKGTAVVAGRAGGIPLQMPEGIGGYLVESIDETVARAVQLLRDPREAQQLGAAGRARVREHMLITRLLRDELRLLLSLG
jgi:trehalose synthase